MLRRTEHAQVGAPALEHSRKVFLLRSLVTDQQWARTVWPSRAVSVTDVAEVTSRLAPLERISQRVGQER